MAAVVETARNDNVTQFLFANHGALWARVFPNVPEATLLLPLPSRNFCKIFAKVSLNISKLNRDEYCVHKLLSQIISYFSKLRKNDCKVILKQKWPSSCTIPTRTFRSIPTWFVHLTCPTCPNPACSMRGLNEAETLPQHKPQTGSQYEDCCLTIVQT